MLRFHFRHWLLRARWLRLTLVALLLTAQQGALVHAVAHAVDAGHAPDHLVSTHAHHHAVGAAEAHDHEGGEHPRQLSAQCAFDLLFGQVLGLAHGAAPVIATHALAAVRPALPVVLAAGLSPVVPYDAHAPPRLS
jgi:hypothetical protein